MANEGRGRQKGKSRGGRWRVLEMCRVSMASIDWQHIAVYPASVGTPKTSALVSGNKNGRRPHSKLQTGTGPFAWVKTRKWSWTSIDKIARRRGGCEGKQKWGSSYRWGFCWFNCLLFIYLGRVRRVGLDRRVTWRFPSSRPLLINLIRLREREREGRETRRELHWE